MNPYAYPAPGYYPPPQQYYPHPTSYYTPRYPNQLPPPATNRSTKYPSLHHILAVDCTTLKIDLKQKPRAVINASTFYAYAGMYAMAIPTTHIRLVSKAFPWSIEIKSTTPITCEAIWDALHSALQEHIADSEWGLVVGEKKPRETIEKAAKKRTESDSDKALKRIDWLGDSTIFRGLEKVEEFQKIRLLPGAEPCAETWVVKMSD
ncbi:hypothetical protein GGU10DRAFT_51036 [Lentinula aff. detonsa]|uniref:DUF6699 domain-containing protein n=1 Tax=Lentinula aff. detonsa TaxID=2804958 RepID=A0AA38NP82_9AGAR|nr:hypothetical protein GGU10DRAFT_51036 [Lentinula aff. detonsa]